MIIGLNFLIFTQIVDLIYFKTAVFDNRRSLRKTLSLRVLHLNSLDSYAVFHI